MALIVFKTMADPARPNQTENDDGERCGEPAGECSCFLKAVEHKGNRHQNTKHAGEGSAERPQQVSDRASFHSVGVETDSSTCKHTSDAQHDDKGKSLPS